MKKRSRCKILAAGMAAALGASADLACDRSSTPPPKPAPAPSTPTEPTPAAPEPDQPRTPAAPAQSATPPTAKTDAPAPISPTTSNDGALPEADLSKIPTFDRDQIEKAREAVAAAPGSADRLAELGMLYCVHDMQPVAAACFKRASEKLPRVMRYHYLLALASMQTHDTATAAAEFRKCIELDGRYVPAYVNLGQLILDSDVIEAKNMFDKAAELDPTDSTAYWGIGRCAVAQKRDDAAIVAFKKAIEVQPNFADAHRDLAEVLRRRGDSAGAEEQAKLAADGRKPLVRNDPILFDMSKRARNEETIAREAVEGAKRGEIKKAIQFFKRSIKDGLDGAPMHQGLGEVYLLAGQFDDAVTALREALKRSPDSIASSVLLASAMIGVGDQNGAETLLQTVLKNHPDNHSAIALLATIDLRRGRLKEAEAGLQRAVELSPGNGSYHLNLAECLAASGRSEDALKSCDRAATRNADATATDLLRGKLLIQTNRPSDAISALKRVADTRPNVEATYIMLADAARMMKDEAASIRYLDNGLRALPNSAALQNDLAYSLAASSDKALRDPNRAVELAKKACKTTLNSDPNYLDTLATACAEARDFKQAAEALRLAIEKLESAKGDAASIKKLRDRMAEYEAQGKSGS